MLEDIKRNTPYFVKAIGARKDRYLYLVIDSEARWNLRVMKTRKNPRQDYYSPCMHDTCGQIQTDDGGFFTGGLTFSKSCYEPGNKNFPGTVRLTKAERDKVLTVVACAQKESLTSRQYKDIEAERMNLTRLILSIESVCGYCILDADLREGVFGRVGAFDKFYPHKLQPSKDNILLIKTRLYQECWDEFVEAFPKASEYFNEALKEIQFI